MPAPALKIPVGLDLGSYKESASRMGAAVDETLKVVGRKFAAVNGEIVTASAGATAGIAAGWAQAAVRIGLAAGAMVAAFQVLKGVVNLAREQIAEMVEIADKANQRGVSPEFFQAFTLAGRGAVEVVTLLEDALLKANRAATPGIDLSASALEVEKLKTKFSELETAVDRASLILQGDSQGPQLFRIADNQDQRIQAVLVTMRDLLAAGQKLEALHLGETMFGREFVDNLRSGKLILDDVIRTVEAKLGRTGDGIQILSNENVTQAKELDDRLKAAHRTIDENLKPSWEALGAVALGIKNLWVEIVELLAKGSALLPKFQFPRNAQGVPIGPSGETDFMQPPGEQRPLGAPPLPPAVTPGPTFAPITVEDIRRRLGGLAEVPKDTGGGGRDRFEASADSIEKRIASLKAEAEAINLGTEAREKARITAELETVAKQVNGEITDEHRKKIDELATAYGKAAAAIENARSPLATFARESANIGKQLNEFATRSLDSMTNELADVVTGTKSAAEAFKAMADSIIRDLARIAIRQTITGPIASALFGAFGGSALSVGGGGGFGGNALDVNNGFVPTVGGGGIVPAGRVADAPSIVPARLAAGRAAGGPLAVNVINNGSPLQVESQRQVSDREFEITVRGIVNDQLASPEVNGVMRQKFGLEPSVIQR